jgi:hypothetical protein
MNRKKLVLGLGCALLLAASAVVVAGIGGDNGNSDLDVNHDRPGGDDCICPLNYDPVVCVDRNPDGTITTRTFSNACFAGCAGFTRCFSSFQIR